MKTTVILFTLLLFSINTLDAQEILKYSQLIRNAKMSLKHGDTVRAASYVDSALAFNLPITNYYLAAYIHYLNGNMDKTYNFLLKAAYKGLTYDELTVDLGGFTGADLNIVKTKIPNLRKMMDANNKAAEANYNMDYFRALQVLFMNDTTARNSKRYLDSLHTDLRNKQINDADSSNFYTLVELVKKHGLPTPETVSETGVFYFTFVTGHNLTTDDEFIRKRGLEYFRYLKSLVMQGRMANGAYANFMDRYFHYQYQQNYYGKFYRSGLPFFEPHNIALRRSEIGLTALDTSWVDKCNCELIGH